MKLPLILLALTLPLHLVSCSDSGGSSSASSGRTTPRTSAAERRTDRPSRERGPVEVKPIDPATVGTVRVTCLFEGEPPARKPLNVSREQACDVHATPPLTEKVVVADGKLANTYVRIKSGLKGWEIPAAPDEPVYFDQKGCIYMPHVVGMQQGQQLLVRNDDPVTHNVNMHARRNPRMNQSQAQKSPPLEFSPAKAELRIQVKCDIHPWMGAWLHVEEHPWFGVSDADGGLVIQDVPPGTYVLEAIHEALGKLTAEVVLEPSGEADVTFTFEE